MEDITVKNIKNDVESGFNIYDPNTGLVYVLRGITQITYEANTVSIQCDGGGVNFIEDEEPI